MSQAGLVDIESSNPQIPTSFVTNSGTAIPIANTLEILGTTVAAHGIPLETIGSGNTVTIEVQRASVNASSDATKAGVASFNSANFTIDSNGFVALSGSGAGQTITGDIGGALVPTAGNWNIFGSVVAAGTNPVRTSGSISTLTTQVQRSQAIASPNSNNVGLSAYNNSQFIVDSTGFVSIVPSILGITIDGDSGSVSGNTVHLLAETGSANCGATVKFNAASSNELDLVVTDVNGNTIMGLGAATGSVTLGQNNTGFGQSVFANIASGTFSTAFGVGCLGRNAYSGTQNTAGGFQSLWSVTSGNNNTGWGSLCLQILTTGMNNACFGQGSGAQLISGSTNALFGIASGSLYTSSESNNVCIQSLGVVGESNTMRVGQGTGAGTGQLNRVFICGVQSGTATGLQPIGVNSLDQISPLGFGTAGQVLTSNGSGNSPTFQAPVTSNTANSAIASGSAISLTTATKANVTSLSLTAGTWVISGIVQFGGTPTVTGVQQASISTTSATHGNLGDNSVESAWLTGNFSIGNVPITIPSYILTLGSTTTVYLVASGVFSAGSMTAYGRISANKIS